jgi:hypothetical protein
MSASLAGRSHIFELAGNSPLNSHPDTISFGKIKILQEKTPTVFFLAITLQRGVANGKIFPGADVVNTGFSYLETPAPRSDWIASSLPSASETFAHEVAKARLYIVSQTYQSLMSRRGLRFLSFSFAN